MALGAAEVDQPVEPLAGHHDGRAPHVGPGDAIRQGSPIEAQANGASPAATRPEDEEDAPGAEADLQPRTAVAAAAPIRQVPSNASWSCGRPPGGGRNVSVPGRMVPLV